MTSDTNVSMSWRNNRKRKAEAFIDRSMQQLLEEIEAEKQKKKRLEWYLHEVLLEKESLSVKEQISVDTPRDQFNRQLQSFKPLTLHIGSTPNYHAKNSDSNSLGSKVETPSWQPSAVDDIDRLELELAATDSLTQLFSESLIYNYNTTVYDDLGELELQWNCNFLDLSELGFQECSTAGSTEKCFSRNEPKCRSREDEWRGCESESEDNDLAHGHKMPQLSTHSHTNFHFLQPHTPCKAMDNKMEHFFWSNSAF